MGATVPAREVKAGAGLWMVVDQAVEAPDAGVVIADIVGVVGRVGQ